jgi:hypothetical protein
LWILYTGVADSKSSWLAGIEAAFLLEGKARVGGYDGHRNTPAERIHDVADRNGFFRTFGDTGRGERFGQQ